VVVAGAADVGVEVPTGPQRNRDIPCLGKPSSPAVWVKPCGFAFGYVTGSFGSVGDSHSIAFDKGSANEMDEAQGDSWVELQPGGSLTGEINF